mgnify:CR=1 FL=1
MSVHTMHTHVTSQREAIAKQLAWAVGIGLAAATAVAFGLHGVASCFRKHDAMEEDKVVKEK